MNRPVPAAQTDRPTALVSGGSRGIGVAICRRLQVRGYDVTAVARTLPAGWDQTGPRLLLGDLRDSGFRADVVSRFTDSGLTVLVNNVGIYAETSLAQVADELLTDMLATNVAVHVALTRDLMPLIPA